MSNTSKNKKPTNPFDEPAIRRKRPIGANFTQKSREFEQENNDEDLFKMLEAERDITDPDERISFEKKWRGPKQTDNKGVPSPITIIVILLLLLFGAVSIARGNGNGIIYTTTNAGNPVFTVTHPINQPRCVEEQNTYTVIIENPNGSRLVGWHQWGIIDAAGTYSLVQQINIDTTSNSIKLDIPITGYPEWGRNPEGNAEFHGKISLNQHRDGNHVFGKAWDFWCNNPVTPTSTATRVVPTLTPTSTATRVVPTLTPTSTATRVVPTLTPTSTATRVVPTLTPTSTATRVVPTLTPTSTQQPSAVVESTPIPERIKYHIWLPIIVRQVVWGDCDTQLLPSVCN
jgi:hypothetical protein